MSKVFFTLLMVFAVQGCFFDSKNQEEEAKANQECSKLTTLDDLTFFLDGYAPAEVSSIVVKEIAPNSDTNVYYVSAGLCDSKIVSYFIATLSHKVDIRSKFLITVRDEVPHMVENIVIGAKPRASMRDVEYECGIIDVTVDGKKAGEGRVTIRKRW